MSTNWTEILSKKPDEVKRPDAVPAGSYIAVITAFELLESKNKGTPFVRYSLRPISPQSDVDLEAFAKFGGSEKLASKTLNLDYYMTPDAQWRLKEFHGSIGIQGNGRTFQSTIPEAVNKQIRIHITHTLNKDRPADPPFTNIDLATGV